MQSSTQKAFGAKELSWLAAFERRYVDLDA